MNIRNRYLELSNQEKKLELIPEIKVFRDQCLLEQNKEYYYLSNLLIVDIYIEAFQNDEAIAILNADMASIDRVTFQKIYVFYLERVIYIYIRKRNFKLAHRYIFEKREFINEKDRSEVNRWYLEMAYVYAEMNDKSKALNNLKAILENLPDEELLSHTLSNLTKLYIDQDLLPEAKETLNQCLMVTHDVEGTTYCNYLLAQIYVKEKKYNEALQLYEEIFGTDFNPDYLTMSVDYLDLLIRLRNFDQALYFMSRIRRHIEEMADVKLERALLKQKLRILLMMANQKEANAVLEKIEELEDQIQSTDQFSLSENLEDERINEYHASIADFTSKLERLISFSNIVFATNSLRDLFMEFSKKMESILELDEITFAIFDKVIPNQEHDEILLYNYKKERLYEKLIAYNDLKNTVIELILIHGGEINLDFSDSSIQLTELGSNKNYQEKGIKYLYAVPFMVDEELFFTVIYKSKVCELSQLLNSSLLKVAAKLLEMKVYNTFVSEKLKIANFANDAISKSKKVHTIYHYRDNIIVSESLKELLNLPSHQITSDEYSKLLLRNDAAQYKSIDFGVMGEYNLEYHLKINKQFTRVVEKVISYQNDQDLFYVGSLEIHDVQPFAYDDEKFAEKIDQLKSRTNDLEFKFSLVRIKANPDEAQEIQQAFQSATYALSDNTVCVILENEVHQRTLDKYMKLYQDRTSVVRFPRDLINIDDVVHFSKISLEHHILYFTEEMYQKYLKKVSVNHLVGKMLETSLEVGFLELQSYTNKPTFEIKSIVKGLVAKENAREYLDDDKIVTYDLKLMENLPTLAPKSIYYVSLHAQSLNTLLRTNKLILQPNLIYCVDSYAKTLINDLLKLKEMGVKVYLDHALLSQLSITDILRIDVEGIMIKEGLQKEERSQLLSFATRFGYALYTNYNFHDYERCVYKTENLVK